MSASEPAVAQAASPPVGHRDILRVALPIAVSNATVPLIGLVDTIVIGQLGIPHLMGAVAIGAMIFNMLYWTFSFLRMGTTGLTAQAYGARDQREMAGHLLRALLVASVSGSLLLIFQQPVRSLMFWLTGGSPEVVAAGHIYFDIRIWAAPAGLINFALLGWFIGLGRAGVAFVLQLVLNLLNMVLAVAFTVGLGGGVAGVGYAALVAEVFAAIVGVLWAIKIARKLGAWAPLSDALDVARLSRASAINLDITVRSLVAFSALIAFTSQGGRAGDVTLAANGLLLNIQSVTVYLLDGFAFAAEAFVGRAIGARDKPNFWRAIELSTFWAFVFAGLCSLAIWLWGDALIAFGAKSANVHAEASHYLFWAALGPLAGVWCFQLDGIFVGATRTRDMRNMMVVSFVIFAVAFLVLPAAFGNHGLWASMMVLFLARAATLFSRIPALVRVSFPNSTVKRF